MKIRLITLTVIVMSLFTTTVVSQVGIGTITPDSSSALDIKSTTQGLLTPRMTTTERTAIVTPANGLLVYDTTELSFFYWDNGMWNKLLSGSVTPADTRDNYKLVKNISDLADELSDGGGSVYELKTNYLYEINGAISFDFPIDLNGANLVGRDTGEDIIINASIGTLFNGSTGGRLKDLLINGNGKQVFNITGGGTQSLIGYSIVVINASSMGTLSNLSTVFFEVLQIVGANDGFNISNINSLFIDKIFWVDSNIGTFLTLSGNFQNLQIGNGRIAVDTGEVGLDVSANPTIGTSGSLAGINFTGAGTRVVPYTVGTYTGYNFTNSWDVDCQGIPQETDNNATGDYNLSFTTGTGTNTTFPTTNQIPVKIQGTTSTNNLFRFSADGSNRLVYEGKRTRYFTVIASISFQGPTTGDILLFYIAKGSGAGNGVPLEETVTAREIGATYDIGAVAVVGTVLLAPGDFVELWTERYSGSGNNVFIASLNMVIK